MSRSECDVLIAGYGPTGAAAALFLADAGLRVRILERSREICDLPRAVGLDGESVRGFQRIGLEGPVTAILQPPRERNEVCFTDSKRNRLFGLAFPEHGWNGWRDMSFFDQPELERVLRDAVDARGDIEVALGVEVEGVEQDAEGVTLHGRDLASGAPRSERGSYAIASDGASSTLRSRLGIPWTSLGYDQDWLVIDIETHPEAALPLETMQVCDPERLTTYVCCRDPYRRWEFQLRPGETREEILRPETIRRLLDPWLPASHYRLRRAAVYQFHAATARRWREGRVFLAGDAAHQTPPFLGQGLNAGIRDAVNLGWKLPRVLDGRCGEALLDTYAGERDAHARDLVDWAVAVGKLMETLAAREAGLPDPHPDADDSAGYGQGRSAPPLRGGVLLAGQSRAEGSPVGHLLRQPTLREGDARPFRLDERLGPGFALLARKESDLVLGVEARALAGRLGLRRVHLEGCRLVEGEHDRLFQRHPAALVRPDRIVFGVVDDTWDGDALVRELARRVALAD